jgi:hypothetical protein
VWVVFFGCSDLAAIAGALPDTISAAVAARGISLAILNIKASHAPFPCAPLRKIAGRLTNFGAVGLDDNLRGHHVAGGAYATAGGEAVGSQELKRLFHRRMLDHTLSGGSRNMPVGLSQCESRVPHKSLGARLVSCTGLICHKSKSADRNNSQLCFHDLLVASKPHAGSRHPTAPRKRGFSFA